MATNLVLSIAWTHVSTRVRQTLVGMFGVAMGVGFTIMMAGLMQGSQIDFLRQLVDTMPHVTVGDERRSVPSQPADQEYAAVGMSNVANVNRRPGIRYPNAIMASLRSWLPGDVAPSVKTTAIVNHGEARVGVSLVGIDPRLEVRVSKLATQMREGQLMNLAQTLMGQNGVVNQLRLRLSDPLVAQKVATQVEAQIGYKSVSWQEANADLLGAFATRDFIVLTVMGAMLLSSSFATYNIISTITHEKRHDIAIMKSLGMREYAVRRIFIIESMMMGAVGILFGWILGYLLCYGWSQITIFNPLTGATVPLQIYYSPMHYVASGAISILCCAVAAFFPARKATRVHPVEIIRGAS